MGNKCFKADPNIESNHVSRKNSIVKRRSESKTSIASTMKHSNENNGTGATGMLEVNQNGNSEYLDFME